MKELIETKPLDSACSDVQKLGRLNRPSEVDPVIMEVGNYLATPRAMGPGPQNMREGRELKELLGKDKCCNCGNNCASKKDRSNEA